MMIFDENVLLNNLNVSVGFSERKNFTEKERAYAEEGLQSILIVFILERLGAGTIGELTTI
jgi:hypothetical protein